ncbi:unnamed protein product [Microthlaspi erraticum]|uniref:Reverse transcriptase Ty1/copia-type domain-containing protein n=1 Tax=Microthlaspi erraticum TaxID=1685480 RepID=A0A6D2IT53_9BRAS|nr:unnamed protein product [Microthlaspi erraticum]
MEPLWTVRASNAPPRPRKPHHFDEEEEEEEPQARSSEGTQSSGVLLMAVCPSPDHDLASHHGTKTQRPLLFPPPPIRPIVSHPNIETLPPSPPPNPSSPPNPSPPPSPPHPSPPPPPIVNNPQTHPMISRRMNGIIKPRQPLCLHTDVISPLPRSHVQAAQDPNWNGAVQSEHSALIKTRTWDLVPRPPNTNVVRSMWLFTHKFNAAGKLDRYKARLVANGKSQQPGVDCDETFSPVIKPASIRAVLDVAVSREWPLHQLDLKNAFLHGDLKETVYMHQPPGFVDKEKPDHVCLLRRSIYGLKQAPRAWYTRFADYAKCIGFTQSLCDPSLFVYSQGKELAYLLLYIDDIILTGSSQPLVRKIISALSTEFEMKDLGKLHHFLGIAVTYNVGGIFFINKTMPLTSSIGLV